MSERSPAQVSAQIEAGLAAVERILLSSYEGHGPVERRSQTYNDLCLLVAPDDVRHLLVNSPHIMAELQQLRTVLKTRPQ